MRPKSRQTYYRSSCPVALLLFLLLQVSPLLADTGLNEVLCLAKNDTIIIDGKRLIVERELLYDTLETPEEITPEPELPKLKKRRSPDTWRVSFEAAPGILAGRLGPNENQAPNLDAFMGQAFQITGSMGLYLGVNRKIGTQGWRFHTGLGVDFLQIENTNFRPDQFSDSLFAFISNEQGAVQHIERFRFPIGAEFDTLETALVSAPFVATWLTVPVGLSSEKILNKSTVLKFGFGADVRLLMMSEQSDLMVITNESPPYQTYQSKQSIDYNRLFVTPYASVGVRFKMDRNWWLTTGLRTGWMFGMMDFSDSGIRYSGAHVQALVGLEYSIGQ